MKICIYGAGAIGGHLALRLARGGADVSMVARGAALAALSTAGISVDAPDGSFTAAVRAVQEPAAIGFQDVVVVSVKAHALPSVAQGIAPLLGPQTRVMFVMNGIPWWYFHGMGGEWEGRRLPRLDPGDALWSTVGPGRVVGATIFSACHVVAPGRVQVVSPRNHLTLGTPDGSDCAVSRELLDTLQRGGMTGEFTPRIRDAIWSKLLVNLSMGPLSVLAMEPQGTVFRDPVCQQALRSILGEAAAIAAAYGCVAGYDAEKQLGTLCRLPHKASLLQDLELGRPMEIDPVIDAPLQLARMANVSTPVLNLLASPVTLRARQAGVYA